MSDRWFRDYEAFSPNRRLRLEARSTIGRDRPYQSGFVYRLLEGGPSGRCVWEGSPPGADQTLAAFVTDDGWVVIRSREDELIGVDPEGRPTGIFKLLVPGRVDRDVHRISGGMHWQHDGMGFREGTTLFVVKTKFGREVIFDVATGMDRTLRDRDEPLPYEPSLDEIFAQPFRRTRTDFAQLYRSVVAREAEARPWLRALERDTYNTVVTLPGGVEATIYPFRQFVRAGLRRIGEQPELGFPPIELRASRPSTIPIAFGAENIRVGSNLAAVLATAGPPERADATSWQWDIEGPQRMTVAVIWSPDGRVVTATHRTPPAWETRLPDHALRNACLKDVTKEAD